MMPRDRPLAFLAAEVQPQRRHDHADQESTRARRTRTAAAAAAHCGIVDMPSLASLQQRAVHAPAENRQRDRAESRSVFRMISLPISSHDARDLASAARVTARRAEYTCISRRSRLLL